MIPQIKELFDIADVEYKGNIRLSDISYAGIGGIGELGAYPKNEAALSELVRRLEMRGICYRVVGGLSNLLIPDEGYGGVMIFTDRLTRAELADGKIILGAGVRLSAIYKEMLSSGVATFDELYGIPGRVGGLVCSNAGANGREISDILISAEAYDAREDMRLTLDPSRLALGYRDSLMKRDRRLICLSAAFKVIRSTPDGIRARVEGFKERRRRTQPVELRSLGSVFKRPEGHFAGELIERSGLKGKRVGGAMISDKHAGFIVNLGGATARDYLSLVELCEREVYLQFGIRLEREIEIL